jgi:hypothetical protein
MTENGAKKRAERSKNEREKKMRAKKKPNR